MNPTAPPNQIDPKLQETYNKVMGTQVAQPAAGASPTPEQTVQPPTAPQAVDPTQAVPPNQYTQDNLSFQAAIQTPPANAAPLQGAPLTGVVPPPKQSSSFILILITIGAIVFFGAYTFIWMIIFNVPVPFFSS